MLATNKGHSNVVKLLLKAKASVNLRDKASNSTDAEFCTHALHVAIREVGSIFIAVCLQSAGWTALFVAATKGYLTIAKLLMKHGA